MSEKIDNPLDEGVALQEAKPKLKKPPLYKVFLLNDDYTPMDFVVHILEVYFSMHRENATRIMLEVHTRGKEYAAFLLMKLQKQKFHWSTIILVKINIHSCVRWKRHEGPAPC